MENRTYKILSLLSLLSLNFPQAMGVPKILLSLNLSASKNPRKSIVFKPLASYPNSSPKPSTRRAKGL